MSSNLVTQIQSYLASTYTIYLKVQNLHWNIKGGKFFLIHELTEKYYENFAKDIDEIAERIRMLGVKVPATLKLFSANTTIKEVEVMDSEDQLPLIMGDFELLISQLHTIINQAASQNDETSVGLFSDILARLEKDLWMLKSHLSN